MVNTKRTTDRIKDRSDRVGVELDAVRVVDEDPDEPIFRVLAVDASDESDQIGFEISHPSGPLAQQMFNQKLDNYLEKLKATVQDDETDGADTDDEIAEIEEELESGGEAESASEHTEAGSTDDADTTFDDGERDSVGSQQSIQVEVTLEGEEFTEEIEQTWRELLAPMVDQIDDIAETVDDHDQRLENIENTFGQLGSNE